MVAIIPITSLVPVAAPPKDSSIRAVITLSWPYSSSTKQCALLLADPDFRLRNQKGQVRARFAGPAAEAIAKSRIGIGDEILLELDGAIWTESPTGLVSTPGRSVEGELVYRGSLGLKVIGRDRDSDIRVLRNVSEEEGQSTLATKTPIKPRQIERLQDGDDGRPNSGLEPLHASPAFVRRLRLSGELFSSPVFDPFDDEDLDVEYVPRKRQRIDWRYADRSPSPPNSSRSQGRAFHAIDSPTISSVPISQTFSSQQTHHASIAVGAHESPATSAFMSAHSREGDPTPVATADTTTVSSHHRDRSRAEHTTLRDGSESVRASPIGEPVLNNSSTPNVTSDSPSRHAKSRTKRQPQHDPTQSVWTENSIALSDIAEKGTEESEKHLCDRTSDEGSSSADEAEEPTESRHQSQLDDNGNAIDLAGAMRDDLTSQELDGTFDRGVNSSDCTVEDDARSHMTTKRLRRPSETDPDDEETNDHMLSSCMTFMQPEHATVVLNSQGSNDIDVFGAAEELSNAQDISDAGHLLHQDNASKGASTDSTPNRVSAKLGIISNSEHTDEPKTPGKLNAHGVHDLTSPTMPQSGSSTRSNHDKIMDQTYRSLFGFDSAPSIDDALLVGDNDQTSAGTFSSMYQNHVMADPEVTSNNDMFEAAFGIGNASERPASQLEASTSLLAYSEASLHNAQLDIIGSFVGVEESADAQPEPSSDDHVELADYRTIGEVDPIIQHDLQHALALEKSAEGRVSESALAGAEPDFVHLGDSIRSRMSMVASHILPPELAAGNFPIISIPGHNANRTQQSDEPSHSTVDRIAETAPSRHWSLEGSLDDTTELEVVKEQLSDVSVSTYLGSQSQESVPPEEQTINGVSRSNISDDFHKENISSDPKIAYRASDTGAATVRAELVEIVRDSRSNVASESPDIQESRVATSTHGVEQAESDETSHAAGSVVALTPDHNASIFTQDNRPVSPSTQSLSRSGAPSSNNLARMNSASPSSEASLDAQVVNEVTPVQGMSLLPVGKQTQEDHDGHVSEGGRQEGDPAATDEVMTTDDGAPTSITAPLEIPTKTLATPFRPGTSIVHTNSAPEGVAATPAARGLLTEQLSVTGRKSKARKSVSARLGHVPDAISSWFSPRRSSRLRTGEEDKVQPANVPEGGRGREESHPKWAAMGIATSYSYFVSLSTLEKRLNNPGQQHHKNTIDVLSVVTQDTKKPVRAKSGPKDFFTVLSIIDPSVEDPGNAVTVEVFRPWHAQLPVAHAGDIVLLRDFAVKSRKRQPYLLSTDASAWCVWRYAVNEPDAGSIEARPGSAHHTRASGLDDAREEVNGPPIELGEEERVRAGELHGWWQGLQEVGEAPVNEASKS